MSKVCKYLTFSLRIGCIVSVVILTSIPEGSADYYEKKQPKSRVVYFQPSVKNDWTAARTYRDIDGDEVDELFLYLKKLMKKDWEYMKYGGWTIHLLLEALNTAYLLTGDECFLEDFVYGYTYLKSYRADEIHAPDYRGMIRPSWYRLEGDDIFHCSPYVDYSESDPDEIMALRGWHNLYFSDINYCGLFLDQMLRFAQIVKNNGPEKYIALADEIVQDARSIVSSHEEEWTALSGQEGYYIFPRGCPFYLDGVEIPVNEAAVFGTSLVRLYLLTGDSFYFERARSMFKRWECYFTYENGYIRYPYVTGSWYEGWGPGDEISVNTPAAKPHTEAETFHKAALTVKFISMLVLAGEDRYMQYIKDFNRVLRTCPGMGDAVSFFPTLLDFSWPNGSYHAYQPVVFSGWVELASESRKLSNLLFLIIDSQLKYNGYKLKMVSARLYLMLMSGRAPPGLRLKSFIVEPLLDGSANPGREHVKAHRDSVVFVTFRHHTPKHNRIYLNVNGVPSKRIRLSVKNDGRFHGLFYAPKGKKITLSWEKMDVYSHPATEEENEVVLTMVSHAWGPFKRSTKPYDSGAISGNE